MLSKAFQWWVGGAWARGAGRYPRCCSPQWIYSKSLQHSNGPAFHHYCHCGRVAWQRKMQWLPSIVHKFIGLSKVDRYSAAFIDVKLGKCFHLKHFPSLSGPWSMAKVCCGRTQPWSCLDPSKGEAPGKKSLSEPGFQVIDAGIHFWNHSLDMCFRMLCGDSVERLRQRWRESSQLFNFSLGPHVMRRSPLNYFLLMLYTLAAAWMWTMILCIFFVMEVYK